MSVLTTISMSACARVNKATAADVSNALKARYGESFVVTHIGNRLNTKTATTYVHPENNNRIVFTAIIDHDGNVIDDYATNIVMDSLEQNLQRKLEDKGIICSVNAVITEDNIVETDTELDPNSFMEKHGIESVLVRLIVDDNSESSENLITILEQMSVEYSFDIVVSVYYLDHNAFELCKKDFSTYPSVGATRIKSYDPRTFFKTTLSNGKSSIPSFELEAILEGK